MNLDFKRTVFACLYVFYMLLFWNDFTSYPHRNKINYSHLLTLHERWKAVTEQVQKWHEHEDSRASAEQQDGQTTCFKTVTYLCFSFYSFLNGLGNHYCKKSPMSPQYSCYEEGRLQLQRSNFFIADYQYVLGFLVCLFFGGVCPLFVPPTHRQMLFEDMTQDLHWMDEHTFKRYLPHFVFQPHMPYNRKDSVKDKSVSSYSIGRHKILTPTGVIQMLPWRCVQVLFKCYVHIAFKASHCFLLCFYSLDSFRH